MAKKSESPRPETVCKEMNFYSALSQVLNGRKIARAVWAPGIHACLVAEHLNIMPEDKIYHPWTLHTSDLAATDWMLVNELN